MEKITKINFLNYEAYELENNNYKAIIVNSYGANVVSLYDKINKIEVLHTPEIIDKGEFVTAPQHFGNALLFPPNKIANGSYTKHNRKYQFPINKERKNPAYSHGILRFLNFKITNKEITKNALKLSMAFRSDQESNAIFEHFPHVFTCSIDFSLSETGLYETIAFTNHGIEPMPIGLGLHTAFKVPFLENTNPDDYRIICSVGKRLQLDDLNYPTGRFYDCPEEYTTTGIKPLKEPISLHTTATTDHLDKIPIHGAIIHHIPTGKKVVYETSDEFGFWMLWNNDAKEDYICIEPMSWCINAPNVSLEDARTGYRELRLGESFISKLWIHTM